MAVAVFTGSPFTNSTTGRHALEKPRRGVVRVLDSGLARMLTGDISSTPTTVGLGIVLMGRMRMIDAVGVTGAFQVRYLASVKVCDPTPANGVPRKMTHNKTPCQVVRHFEKEKKTYTPEGCWWAARSDSSISSMTFSEGPPAWMFPIPPRPAAWIGSRDRERD